MKVALVCDWYLPRLGGIELHLSDLAKRLNAAGHDVVVISPTPGAPVVDGVRIVRIDAPRAPVFGFLCTPAGVRAIGRALELQRPDVAHCHVSIVSPAAIGGAFAAERLGIPVALTFHSVVPRMQHLVRLADGLFQISKLSAAMSAVSERVARDVRALAGTRTMHVVPNGIDVAFWRAEEAERSGGDLRLISVMRLNSKKRPLALVDIMQRAVAQLPSALRVTLRIVGDGPMRPALARAVARSNLADRITLVGRVDRHRVRELLSESDVFLLPTVRESFGLAALEARCVGLPVVARADSGVAELIEHGTEGLLGRSDADLAAHIVSLARDDASRAAIARHNRAFTPAHDWARVLDANIALYREAISLRNSV